MLRQRVLAVAIAALVASGVAAAPAAAAPPPPGANDWSCVPSAAHPRPAVLVHGTFENRWNNWQALSPLLKANGYCVYALDYGAYNGSGLLGVYGVGDIPASAGRLDAFVDRVRAATGAPDVDVVGHSQGGMMPRWYDEVVTPYTSAFLSGADVTHILQDQDPANRAQHVTIPYDPLALADVLAALR
jgi:triacylglycerol esterase/lipase EstA (alpha/beta hydrolase family)